MGYKAPLREIKFVMDELLDMPGHYASIPAYAEVATPEMIDAIVAEGAKFCEQELAPLQRVGDTEGCTRHEDGSVTTPTGFKEAYEKNNMKKKKTKKIKPNKIKPKK